MEPDETGFERDRMDKPGRREIIEEAMMRSLRAENAALKARVEYLQRVHADAVATLRSAINSLQAVEHGG